MSINEQLNFGWSQSQKTRPTHQHRCLQCHKTFLNAPTLNAHTCKAIDNASSKTEQINKTNSTIAKKPDSKWPLWVLMLFFFGSIALIANSASYKEAQTKTVSSQPAATKARAVPGSIVAAGDVAIGGIIGCARLNEGALSTGKATGRIFDLSDPDGCRGIHNGTVVVQQKSDRNAVCVLPDGAAPPCLWVLHKDLAIAR